MTEKAIKVTQVKSAAARTKRIKNTLDALGLGSIGKTRIVTVNPATIGMLAKVEHLIKVEEKI